MKESLLWEELSVSPIQYSSSTMNPPRNSDPSGLNIDEGIRPICHVCVCEEVVVVYRLENNKNSFALLKEIAQPAEE